MPTLSRTLIAAICVIAAASLVTTMAFAAGHATGKMRSTCRHVAGRQVGKAMFYGAGFNGRTMANGKVFDANALTGASRTLPLGTRATVTNLRTHRSVDVVITDRGRLRAPHVILDLSEGAARAIGLTEHEGIAPVAVLPTGCV